MLAGSLYLLPLYRLRFEQRGEHGVKLAFFDKNLFLHRRIVA